MFIPRPVHQSSSPVSQRAVLLDSDMLILKNIDDLMELDIPPDSIAAAHACACNPRKFPQYPKDWLVAVVRH